MKNITKNFVLLFLIISCLLPLSISAAKGENSGGGSDGTVVIDGATVSIIDSAVYFSGSGLTDVSVELAGSTFTPGAGSSGTVAISPFDASLAAIVTREVVITIL